MPIDNRSLIHRKTGLVAAVFIIAMFAVLQAATLGYGTKVNDLPYVAGYKVTTNIAQGSGLETTR